MQFSTEPLVSIIIPCYNHGAYIRDALQSILDCEDKHLCEVIIIDDGSTDQPTITELEKLKAEGWTVITQVNQGLSAARNTGIAHAKAPFILPVDSDNKIRNAYLRAAAIMQQDSKIDVIYGDAWYFGLKDGRWTNQPWSLQRIMLSNHIDACALIRASTLREAGGYDTRLRLGYEDWDLWLRLSFRGCNFYYLPEICFDYRVVKGSMVRRLTGKKERSNSVLEQMYQLHKPYMDPAAIEDFILKQYRKNPVSYSFKLFLKAYLPGVYGYLYKKNLVRKYF